MNDHEQTPAGQGSRLAEGELDRALASLTDVAPSSALRANVMRRIAEERATHLWDPASAGFRIRVALAMVAVALIALASLFALRPGPASQVARSDRVPHDIVLSAPASTSATETTGPTASTRLRPKPPTPERAEPPVLLALA